jgi:hypothetical protein
LDEVHQHVGPPYLFRPSKTTNRAHTTLLSVIHSMSHEPKVNVTIFPVSKRVWGVARHELWTRR